MNTRALSLLFIAGLAVAVLIWSLSKTSVTSLAPNPSTDQRAEPRQLDPDEQARAQATPQGRAANLQGRTGSKDAAGSDSSNHSLAKPVANQTTGQVARESSGNLKTVQELIPNVGEMRKEVAANPHLTPMAITRFSLALGHRLDALQTVQDGSAFMAELDGCVTDRDQRNERNIRTVQSLCILNARKTRNKFPELEKQYQDVKKKADPAARAIEEALE
jgi:hypothetical protein